MKFSTTHPVYGEILLDWGFWSGNATLYFDDVEIIKIGKMTFELGAPENGTPIPVALHGTILKGYSITVGNESIAISPKAKWYDIVLGIIPAIMIFLYLGGAIGGGIGGAVAVLTTITMLLRPNIKQKILICLGISAISLLASMLLASIISLLF